MRRFLLWFGCFVLLCQFPAEAGIVKAPWGVMPDGRKIDIYTLSNANGMQVQISTYSAAIISIRVPDRNGKMSDVVMSYPTLAGYIADEAKGGGARYGEVLGRYANRIGGAKFTLDGKTYRLVTAKGAKDQLHGGPRNLATRTWTAKGQGGAQPSLSLTVKSPNGDQGFPGNIVVHVTYTLLRNNTLKIDYRASTDAPTVINLTNHAYFNLKGDGDVLDTRFQFFAHNYTPVGPGEIPTGQIEPVTGTPYDFTSEQVLRDRLAQLEALPGNQRRRGYDVNMVIDGAPGTLRLAARAEEPSTGRVLEVWTTQPGFQFYTPVAVRDPDFIQRGFREYPAFCIEAEHYPDSPNHPNFPSTEITPTKPLHEVTLYKFSVEPNK